MSNTHACAQTISNSQTDKTAMFIDAYLASLGTSQSWREARMWSLTRIDDDPETDEVTENKHNIINNNNNNNSSSSSSRLY